MRGPGAETNFPASHYRLCEAAPDVVHQQETAVSGNGAEAGVAGENDVPSPLMVRRQQAFQGAGFAPQGAQASGSVPSLLQQPQQLPMPGTKVSSRFKGVSWNRAARRVAGDHLGTALTRSRASSAPSPPKERCAHCTPLLMVPWPIRSAGGRRVLAWDSQRLGSFLFKTFVFIAFRA